MFTPQHHPEPAAAQAETFDAGKVIIEHVSNSPLDHPLIQLPPVFGIDFSVTKHVFMLWVVSLVLFTVVTLTVRRYVRQQRLLPTGLMNVLEIVVEFVRDSMVEPSVGRKWVRTWTPFILTLFLFIFSANITGLIPVFEVLGLLDHYVLHSSPDSFISRVRHGGATVTGNYNVTAGLATISFVAIIVAGSRANGVITHWLNLAPKGLAWPLYFLLIPIEIIGMFVRPFALTMRLAANMTGGHIAILAVLSFVFVIAQLAGTPMAGIGVGLLFSVPLGVGVSALEIVVILVQAYVFSLLTAVFIGMAIHAHH